MFFERCCPICHRPSSAVCAACWERLEPAAVRWLASPEPSDEHDLEVRSLFVYAPEAASMLLAAKNGGRRDVLRQVGRAIAGSLSDIGPIDYVTWVPATPANTRGRGFDQGRLLARSVAAGLGVPARSLLTRPRGGDATSQKGKNRHDRLQGAALVASRPTTARLLLVDDVITTGASMRHGADALLSAGATTVVAATAASSNDPRRRRPEVTFGLLPPSVEPA